MRAANDEATPNVDLDVCQAQRDVRRKPRPQSEAAPETSGAARSRAVAGDEVEIVTMAAATSAAAVWCAEGARGSRIQHTHVIYSEAIPAKRRRYVFSAGVAVR